MAPSVYIALRLAGLAAVLVTAACTHTLPSPLCVPCDSITQEHCVTFRVISFVPGKADLPVSSAPVFLFGPHGLLLLGHTPPSGEFIVSRSALLAQPKPAVLLFCWDHVSRACTAVRLDLPDAAYWDAFNVTLPVNPLGSPRIRAPTELILPIPLP